MKLKDSILQRLPTSQHLRYPSPKIPSLSHKSKSNSNTSEFQFQFCCPSQRQQQKPYLYTQNSETLEGMITLLQNQIQTLGAKVATLTNMVRLLQSYTEKRDQEIHKNQENYRYVHRQVEAIQEKWEDRGTEVESYVKGLIGRQIESINAEWKNYVGQEIEKIRAQITENLQIRLTAFQQPSQNGNNINSIVSLINRTHQLTSKNMEKIDSKLTTLQNQTDGKHRIHDEYCLINSPNKLSKQNSTKFRSKSKSQSKNQRSSSKTLTTASKRIQSEK